MGQKSVAGRADDDLKDSQEQCPVGLLADVGYAQADFAACRARPKCPAASQIAAYPIRLYSERMSQSSTSSIRSGSHNRGPWLRRMTGAIIRKVQGAMTGMGAPTNEDGDIVVDSKEGAPIPLLGPPSPPLHTLAFQHQASLELGGCYTWDGCQILAPFPTLSVHTPVGCLLGHQFSGRHAPRGAHLPR